MDVAIPRHVVETKCLAHLRLRAAACSTVRHRQSCRHAERREDHVVAADGTTNVLVEVNGESAVGSDDDALVVARRGG